MATRYDKQLQNQRRDAKNDNPYSRQTPLVAPPPSAPTTQTATGSMSRPLPPSPYLNSPSWWREAGLTGAGDPGSFARVANAVLPFLASPDQEAVRTFLGTQAGFGHYLTGATGQTAIAPTATPQTEQKYLNAQRASQLLAKLDQMRSASNLTEDQLGPGYKFLRRAIDLLQQFGITSGEQSMSRAEYEQLQTQLSTMAEQAKSDRSLAPYAELATQFLNPTIIGQLMPSSQVGGNTVYGQANKKLFT